MERCLAKMKRLSISNFGPPELPTVSRRPPFLSVRRLCIKVVPDVVHHHVHALLVRGQEDGFGPVLFFGTVDQDVCAEGFRFLQLLRIGAHDHDLRAAIFGDIYAGGIDSAPRADDEHCFALLQLPACDQRVPGCLVDQGGRGSFAEIKIGGQFVELAGRQGYVFGIRSAHGFAQQVPVPAHVVPAGEAVITFTAAQVGVDDHAVADPQPPSVPPLPMMGGRGGAVQPLPRRHLRR